MKVFSFPKILSVCLILLLLLCTGGVWATWIYAEVPIHAEHSNMGMGMSVFDFSPEAIIPGGAVEAPLGQNHLSLIELILNEVSYGLNATKKPVIHNTLKNPGDVLYCSQTVQGGNLKHLMIDSVTASEQLYFVITKISDTEYHTFTFLDADLDYVVGTEISVYKTVMVKGENGKWTAPKSYQGYAKVNRPQQVSKGIDVTSYRNA